MHIHTPAASAVSTMEDGLLPLDQEAMIFTGRVAYHDHQGIPLGDEELDRAAPVSLNSDAPLTCQFMLEDHAVRHSYHHLDRIRAVFKSSQPALRAS